MHMSLSKEFPTLNTHSATKPQNLPVCNYTGHKALNAQDIHSLVLWSPNPTIICPSVLFTGVWPHELSALEKKKTQMCILLITQASVQGHSIIAPNTEANEKHKLLAQ